MSTDVTVAEERSAFLRLAYERFVPVKSAFAKLALLRIDPKKLAL